MKQDDVAAIIERINKESGKYYNFLETHNPRLPTNYWFQYPAEGLTLFLILYTRTCRWSRCTGCNLPASQSQYHVSFQDIMKQVDYIFDFILDGQQKQDIKKIILSNNGSILDEVTFSTTALLYFLARMNTSCPNVSVLSIETRPEYVDMAELEVLHRALSEGYTSTALELAVGFEAFDEKIRNELFRKGLTLDVFEAMVQKIAEYKFRLKVYFMLKPVAGISEADAVLDVVNGIRYLDTIGRHYNITINMHLNPTYVSQGTPLEVEFNKGNYTPPRLESVLQAVRAAQGTSVSVYVGLFDEGLAVPGGSFLRPGDESLQQKLTAFNHTGDFSLLQ